MKKVKARPTKKRGQLVRGFRGRRTVEPTEK